MNSELFPMLRRFFLFTALIVFIAGCGSGGSGNSSSSGSTSTTSPASSTTSIDTGAIAVKLAWNANGSSALAKTTDKVLYALPVDVMKVKIIVSGPGISPDIEGVFDATAHTGTLSGIPAGDNRVVTVQGLDASGTVVLYEGTKSSITINAGQTTDAGIITMVDVLPPVTTATPSSGGVNAGSAVTLTANEPATIYYTTNGDDPSTPGSPSGPHTGVSITISTSPTTIKFFAIDTAGNKETVKSATYTINLGSLTYTW